MNSEVMAVPDESRRWRGIIVGAFAAIIVAAIYVILRQRNTPDLLVQSDEGWQPDVRAAVGGEVINPGTYTLGRDARLSDLVSTAGGYTERADRAALNPAARVGDGMEYIIPAQSARAATATSRTPAATSAAIVSPPATAAAATPRARAARTATGAPAVVNINTATKEELEALPAIGPTIAQRILDDRTANGPYKQIEDLARVRGVSARTVNELRSRITVGP